MKTLNELAQDVHAWSKPLWWTDIKTGEPIQRNPYELLMLVITDLAEAMEGERKDLMDDKLPHRKMAEVEMADAFIRLLDFSAGFGHGLSAPKDIEYNEQVNGKCPISKLTNKGEALLCICHSVLLISTTNGGGYGASVTVAILAIQAYCEAFGYDLMGAYEEKMAYNATREDHTHEARMKAGGKKF